MTSKDFIWLRMSGYDIEQAKQNRKQKDIILGKNYFESENRWIGELGEIAFERFAKSKAWDISYNFRTWQDDNLTSVKDLYDCTLSHKIIDVKTNQVKYKPGCIVNGNELLLNAYVIDTQFYRDSSINTYVFTKYWFTDYGGTNKHYIILVGWLPKETFGYIADTFVKGFPYPRENVNFPKMAKTGIRNTMLDLLYYNLNPIIELPNYY